MIFVHGGNQQQKHLAQQLYHFCIEALSIQSKVDIDLFIQDIEHVEAWIDHEGDGKFYIDIEKDLDEKSFIIAFCHEMVHVNQHLKGKPISEKEAYSLEKSLARQFQSSKYYE